MQLSLSGLSVIRSTLVCPWDWPKSSNCSGIQWYKSWWQHHRQHTYNPCCTTYTGFLLNFKALSSLGSIYFLDCLLWYVLRECYALPRTICWWSLTPKVSGCPWTEPESFWSWQNPLSNTTRALWDLMQFHKAEVLTAMASILFSHPLSASPSQIAKWHHGPEWACGKIVAILACLYCLNCWDELFLIIALYCVFTVVHHSKPNAFRIGQFINQVID